MAADLPILGGKFLGTLPPEHPYNSPWEPPHFAVHRDTLGMSPEDYMKQRPYGEEGFFSPGSDMLWIRQPPKDESVPMSGRDLDPNEAAA